MVTVFKSPRSRVERIESAKTTLTQNYGRHIKILKIINKYIFILFKIFL